MRRVPMELLPIHHLQLLVRPLTAKAHILSDKIHPLQLRLALDGSYCSTVLARSDPS